MGKQAESGWATGRQCHVSLRALPLPGAEEPRLGSASSAHTSSLWAGSIWESKALGKGESSPPISPTMHETWGTFQKLQLFQKPATLQLCSTGQRGLMLQTLLRCFI